MTTQLEFHSFIAYPLLRAIVYIVISYYYSTSKPVNWKEYMMLNFYCLTMEIFVFAQMTNGNVYYNIPEFNQLYGIPNCDSINRFYTIVAYCFFWTQPILLSYVGYRINVRLQSFFSRYIVASILILVYSLYTLIYSIKVIENAAQIKYNISDTKEFAMQGSPHNIDMLIMNSSYGLDTCTNMDDTGYLVWRFNPLSVNQFTNPLMLFVLNWLVVLNYNRELKPGLLDLASLISSSILFIGYNSKILGWLFFCNVLFSLLNYVTSIELVDWLLYDQLE